MAKVGQGMYNRRGVKHSLSGRVVLDGAFAVLFTTEWRQQKALLRQRLHELSPGMYILQALIAGDLYKRKKGG